MSAYRRVADVQKRGCDGGRVWVHADSSDFNAFARGLIEARLCLLAGFDAVRVDDRIDFGTARSAIGAGLKGLADVFDGLAFAAGQGGRDLVGSDGITGADDRAWIGQIGAGSARKNAVALGRRGHVGGELANSPGARYGYRVAGYIEGPDQAFLVERGVAVLAGFLIMVGE